MPKVSLDAMIDRTTTVASNLPGAVLTFIALAHAGAFEATSEAAVVSILSAGAVCFFFNYGNLKTRRWWQIAHLGPFSLPTLVLVAANLAGFAYVAPWW